MPLAPTFQPADTSRLSIRRRRVVSSSKARVSAACWPCAWAACSSAAVACGDRLLGAGGFEFGQELLHLRSSWAASCARIGGLLPLELLLGLGAVGRRWAATNGGQSALRAAGVGQVHPAAQLVGFLEQPDGGLGQDRLAVRRLVAVDAEGVQLRDDDPGDGLVEAGVGQQVVEVALVRLGAGRACGR